MKFARRTSAGSSPASTANASTARSSTCDASGRPAPRSAAVGLVFVTTESNRTSIRGIRYTPEAISRVSVGRIAPTPG